MLHDRHFILGEGAGFIGADDLGAAKGLHGGQPADDGIFLCHFRDPDREDNGDDRCQALRDGGDGQRHGHHKGF